MYDTVWKYKLEYVDYQTISMPKGATVIHAGLDGKDDVCIWVRHDIEQEREDVVIHVNKTGGRLPDDFDDNNCFIGIVTRGYYVWHIYRRMSV